MSVVQTVLETNRLKAPHDAALLARLRAIAYGGLARMYRPRERLFGFCVRRGPAGDVLEGLSRRYTAITLLGLAEEPPAVVAGILAGETATAVGARLLRQAERFDNLGDVALTLWAAHVLGIRERGAALARLEALQPVQRPHATVELAWTLTALTLNDDLPAATAQRDAVARRLLSAIVPASGLFRHMTGERGGWRQHVACFADIVYPVQALSLYYQASGDAAALAAAEKCAARAVQLQGTAGQWWWHYDVRSGRVIEPYPVYSVHQDGMAPMALFALAEAGGTDHRQAVQRGLDWLTRAPELGGDTLIDGAATMIWRKVARREPRKLTRGLQAAASAVHPAWRVPGLDTVFPPLAVDWECRPYHLGWLLYAWSPTRLTHWGLIGATS